jgi:hypothetical protein
MTALAGTVWGDLRTSHLYAIFKGEYVYFGETGNMPPARWKSHMTSDTDFVGKLKAVDPAELAKQGSPLFFVGVCISMADLEPTTKQKIARRAIEAELHRRFALDATPVLPASKLLSSSPAAPVGHTFSFDKVGVATAVYSLIADEYQRWRSAATRNPTGDVVASGASAATVSVSVASATLPPTSNVL